MLPLTPTPIPTTQNQSASQLPAMLKPASNGPGFSLEAGSELNVQSNPQSKSDQEPLREAFGDFVGQTLFGSMLSSMRETVGKPAYFHGGRTEEVFQKQLDQHLVDAISDASADSVANPMFELFQLQRRS